MSAILTSPLIVIVDDEPLVREATENLLRSAGLRSVGFGSAEEFLDSAQHRNAGCLILDVQLPGMSGLELQDVLACTGPGVPIVFLTAHDDADGRTASRALKAGAKAFLRKPMGHDDLLCAVQSALESSHA